MDAVGVEFNSRPNVIDYANYGRVASPSVGQNALASERIVGSGFPQSVEQG